MLETNQREPQNNSADKKSDLIRLELQKYLLLKNKGSASGSKPTISTSENFDDPTPSEMKRNGVSLADILSPQTYQNLMYVKEGNFSSHQKSTEKKMNKELQSNKENLSLGKEKSYDHINLPRSVNDSGTKDPSVSKRLRYSIETKEEVVPLFPLREENSFLNISLNSEQSRGNIELPCEAKWSKNTTVSKSNLPPNKKSNIPLSSSKSRKTLNGNLSETKRNNSKANLENNSLEEVEKWKLFAKLMVESQEEMKLKLETIEKERSRDKKIIFALKSQVSKLKQLVVLTNRPSIQSMETYESERQENSSHRLNTSASSISKSRSGSMRCLSRRDSNKQIVNSKREREINQYQNLEWDKSSEELPPMPMQFTIVPTSEEQRQN